MRLRERDGIVSVRMLTLFGNAFSPFSRKVQLVLEYKGVDYEMVDGLSHGHHEWFVNEIEEGHVL